MSTKNFTVAIVSFQEGTAPLTLAGRMSAAHIVETVARRCVMHGTVVRVFASDGAEVAYAVVDDEGASWVPVNAPRMSSTARTLYDALWQKHKAFQQAFKRVTAQRDRLARATYFSAGR